MKRNSSSEEIDAVRRKISARFGHDRVALLQHYKELEAKYKDRIYQKPQAPAEKEYNLLTGEKSEPEG